MLLRPLCLAVWGLSAFYILIRSLVPVVVQV